MRHFLLSTVATLPCILLAACETGVAVSPPTSLPTEVVMIANFDNSTDASLITANNAETKISNGILDVDLKSKDNFYTGLKIAADTPWNWADFKSFGIAMDIGNSGTESVQLNLDVKDASGAGFTRSAVIPVGSTSTYYAELKGVDIAEDSGLRDNPVHWDIDGTKFTWMWGTEQLNTSAITEISLSAVSLNSDRKFTLDNIRLITNPKTKPNYLTGLVDKFGQNAKLEFPGKVHSEKELKKFQAQEKVKLTRNTMNDRSKFGGWATGPKLKATGYFRTEKVGGKWAFIDPEGHLFFSTGIANIRMSNTSTMTGRDYPAKALNQRTSSELTPEDSLGLNPAPKSALPSRFVASDLRDDMFQWLPDANDPLSNHYGYRREVHTGPVKQGESYSFYSANLERKFGETSPASFMRDWRDTTLDRMNNWGFTSFGNWVDPMFYDNERVPYFANGWIIGDFKTVSSGDDFWAPLPDVFDPVFKERAIAVAKQVASEVKNSPWCVGVFIDNEKSWGRMGSVKGQYGIAINTLSRDGKDSPTKAVFTKLMQEKYGSIGALNKAWGKNLKSWRDFDNGVDVSNHTDTKQADYAIMLEAYASEYFRIVSSAVEDNMPNHLYMGVRFASWGMTPEVVDGANKYVDVMSVNEYREVPQFSTWEFLERIDKPTVIGEFHMGATSDTGLFHAGLVKAADQEDRARMYTNYMNTVIDNPYLVGAHWFQYIDSPITGRAYDGENYNVGFVRVTDTPYEPMVDAAKAMNKNLYTRRFGK